MGKGLFGLEAPVHRQGKLRQGLKGRPWRIAAYWLVPGLHLSDTGQAQGPRRDTGHGGLGSPTAVKKIPHGTI